MATTEFILSFPPFLLLMLLTVEFALISADRHLLTAAAFSAARGVMIDVLAPESEDSQRVATGDPLFNPMLALATAPGQRVACREKERNAARRRAAIKLGVTSPTIGELAVRAGLQGGFGLAAGADALKRYRSLGRVVLGYPVAYLQTSVQCFYDSQGVTLTARYQRNPKTPYAGTLIWALYMLSRIDRDADAAMRADLRGDFHGVALSGPATDQLRSKLIGQIEALRRTGFKLDEIASALEANPLLRRIFDSEGLRNAARAGTRGMDEATAVANRRMDSAVTSIDAQEKVVTSLLYAVPDAFRTVPLEKSVFVAWGSTGFQRQSRSDWERPGINVLVAPYKKGNVHDAAGHIAKWESWTKSLSEHAGGNLR